LKQPFAPCRLAGSLSRTSGAGASFVVLMIIAVRTSRRSSRS